MLNVTIVLGAIAHQQRKIISSNKDTVYEQSPNPVINDKETSINGYRINTKKFNVKIFKLVLKLTRNTPM